MMMDAILVSSFLEISYQFVIPTEITILLPAFSYSQSNKQSKGVAVGVLINP